MALELTKEYVIIFSELIDTFFLVIHKKKVLFLHWYHHITVLLYTWYGFTHASPIGVHMTAMNVSKRIFIEICGEARNSVNLSLIFPAVLCSCYHVRLLLFDGHQNEAQVVQPHVDYLYANCSNDWGMHRYCFGIPLLQD